MVNLVSPKTKKSSKDWKVLEYVMPISEAVNSGNDFMIRGVAINETTTRNGITYVASELQEAAPSFRNKPIMTDHSGSVKDIVGRTTEAVNFNSINKSIDFEGRIMDENIKEMINDGRITDVSIGAKVRDLVKNEKDDTIIAVGMEGLEISLVAVPGDPGANLANSLSEAFKLKEMDMNGETIDLSEEEADKFETELNDDKEDNMGEAEEEKKAPEEAVETPEEKAPEAPAEEKLDVKAIQAGITENAKGIAALTELMTKKIKEDAEETPAPSAEAEGKEIPAPVEDETKGDVGGEAEADAPADVDESFIVEKADVGPGLQISRDYSKATGKFNRLCR